MLAVMGTSTCHIMNGDALAEVPGMCGVVQGGVTPGLWGYEAGQSGVGDIFAWFADNAVPPRYHDEARAKGIDLHDHLSQLAGEQEVGQHGLVALDWNNGNRSVLVDHELSGLIVGLTLSTRAEDVYRALIEATAFGTRKIIETFEASGLPVRELIVAGGLLKNPVIMQIYADVTRRPLHLIDSEQGPALGSAMHAAVAAGAYPDIYAAAGAMGKAAPRRLRARRVARRPPTTRSTSTTRPCTTTSGAAATTSCTRCATSARARSPVADELAELRREVCALHAELPRHGLVAWTSGNLSARVPGEELMVIKASGVPYAELTPEAIVVCDLHGGLVEGDLAPSSRRRHPRLRLPPPRRTSAASRTPTAPTPPRGRRAARRSRACSPRWPTSSAARSPSARSP